MLINVGITPHVLVKSDFCEFIIHSGRLSVSTVLKSCFKTKFIRDMTRGGLRVSSEYNLSHISRSVLVWISVQSPGFYIGFIWGFSGSKV